MLNINKRVSIERKSIERKSFDSSSILKNKSSDDSINSPKGLSSPVNNHTNLTSRKKKILLFTEDSNDSDFEYY